MFYKEIDLIKKSERFYVILLLQKKNRGNQSQNSSTFLTHLKSIICFNQLNQNRILNSFDLNDKLSYSRLISYGNPLINNNIHFI